MERVVRRGLVGDRVGPDPATDEFGQDLGRVAEQADGHRHLLEAGSLDPGQGVVQVARLDVQVASPEPHRDPLRPALDGQARRPGHGGRERLGAAHPAQPGGQHPPPAQVAAVVPSADLGERLIGPLDDPLAADVDPRPGRHLAVHHQAAAVQLVEMVPRRPARDQVRVGDQHARGVRVGAEHPDRLARLDEERLIILQPGEGLDDPVVALPVAGGAADPAVDDQVGRPLGDLRVEVVHEHAQGGFGLPAPGRQRRPPRGADRAGRVGADHGLVLAGGSGAGPRVGSSRANARHASRTRDKTSRDRRGERGVVLRRPIRLVRRVGRLGEVAADGQLHLDRRGHRRPAGRNSW